MERDLGIALGIEERGGAEVSRQVPILDHERAGIDDAYQLRRVLSHGQRGVEPLEAASESRYAHVLDREARGGMWGVQAPRSGGETGGAEDDIGDGHTQLLELVRACLSLGASGELV